MKAKEVLEKYVLEEERENVSVIAILEGGEWWHVHTNEEVPNTGERIALLVPVG